MEFRVFIVPNFYSSETPLDSHYEFLYRAVLIILERKNLRVSLAAESVV